METFRMVPEFGINCHLRGTHKACSIMFGTLDPN